jgi:C-terminal processing protease CtpA/Prc
MYKSLSWDGQVEVGDYAMKTDKDTVSLELLRNSDTVRVVMLSGDKWFKSKYPYDKSWLHLSPEIGYINLEQHDKTDNAPAMSDLKDTKAIIIDLRGYPKSYQIYDLIGNYFYPDNKVFTLGLLPVLTMPGYCKFDAINIGTANPNYYSGQVLILIDGYTYSQAEYTAMCLQALSNSITIGSHTAGTDGDRIFVYFPGSVSTRISSWAVLYPDGSETQRVGINIDIPVTRTLDDIKSGTDRILQTAIEYADAL